jgi:hypothetical protein
LHHEAQPRPVGDASLHEVTLVSDDDGEAVWLQLSGGAQL